MSKIERIQIRGEFITLGQLLKFTDEVGNGGEVRDVLAEETTQVNGEVCTLRGKKVRPGDKVLLPSGRQIEISAQ